MKYLSVAKYLIKMMFCKHDEGWEYIETINGVEKIYDCKKCGMPQSGARM